MSKADDQSPLTPGTEVLSALPPERIDRTAAAVVELARSMVRNTALEIGTLVIRELYDGDVGAWRTRGQNDPSFRALGRALSRHGEGGVSPSTLFRACGLVELEDRLGVSALEQLTASHGFAVLGLPGPVQEDLLARARGGSWTTRELLAAVAAHRKTSGPRRGRRPKPRFARSLDKMERMLAEGGFADLEDEQLDRLGPERTRELQRTADRMLGKLAHLSLRLEEAAGEEDAE
ncbi:MAG TPA: hypothetical protein QGF58_18590 [Myxococcota bacterium]|nr:hypothetical protein [Myxococcota bacterium]